MKKRKISNDDVGGSDATPAAPGFDVEGLFALASTEPAHVASEYQPRVAEFVDFVGCVLGIVLSDRQIEWLRTHTAEALAQSETGEAGLIATSIEAFRAVKDAHQRTRHTWRQENQPRFVSWLADAADSLSSTLREWHAAAQHVLVDDRPPLTREAAESWVELSTFASLIVAGKEPGTATPKNLEVMIARLADGYRALHPQQKLWMSFAPVTLYEIRRSWPTMSAAERQSLRDKLAAQFDLQQSQPAAPPKAPTEVAPASSVQRPARASAWDRFRDDSSVECLQRQWAEAQDQNDHRRAAELELEIQNGLQRQAEASAMLTNMMAMRHSAMMKVAGNLKS